MNICLLILFMVCMTSFILWHLRFLYAPLAIIILCALFGSKAFLISLGLSYFGFHSILWIFFTSDCSMIHYSPFGAKVFFVFFCKYAFSAY